MFMQDWQILAFATSFFTAFYIHVNHSQKICGLTLVLLRGLFMLVLLSPTVLFFKAPQDPRFYFFGFLVGLFVVLGDKYLLNAAAKHGGRLTSLFISLKIFFVFTLWSFLSPDSFFGLLEQPLVCMGMLLCYALMVFAMVGLRRQEHSSAALMAVVPAAVFLGVSDVLSKMGLSEHQGIGALLYFLLVGQLGCVVGSSLFLHKDLWRRPAHVFSRRHLKGTLVLLLPFVFLLLTYMSAVARSPNPAYVGAITVLTTVWLTLYYRFVRDDSADWKASLMLVAAAMGLTLLTA